MTSVQRVNEFNKLDNPYQNKRIGKEIRKLAILWTERVMSFYMKRTSEADAAYAMLPFYFKSNTANIKPIQYLYFRGKGLHFYFFFFLLSFSAVNQFVGLMLTYHRKIVWSC